MRKTHLHQRGPQQQNKMVSSSRQSLYTSIHNSCSGCRVGDSYSLYWSLLTHHTFIPHHHITVARICRYTDVFQQHCMIYCVPGIPFFPLFYTGLSCNHILVSCYSGSVFCMESIVLIACQQRLVLISDVYDEVLIVDTMLWVTQ